MSERIALGVLQMGSKRIEGRILYLIAPSAPDGRRLDLMLPPLIEAGIDVVQLRDKASETRPLIDVGRRIGAVCAEHGALFIVNDRVDVAIACGADGVHLGQDDLGVDLARGIAGSDLIIGLSTHSEAQVVAAQGSDADYIGVGPVFSTPTKPGRPAVGTALVTLAAKRSSLPFFAIGGIDHINLREVAAAGARRVAVLRAILDADDPVRMVRDLKRTLDGAPTPNSSPVGFCP